MLLFVTFRKDYMEFAQLVALTLPGAVLPQN